MPRPKSTKPKNHVRTIRLTESEHKEMEDLAERLGFPSVSEYVRYIHNQHTTQITQITQAQPQNNDIPIIYPDPQVYFNTELGRAYLGDSLGLLHNTLAPESVDLIMTSPPFGLVRKKSYGNEHANDYVNWFRPFAEGFKRVLKPQGSLVIDIGGAWEEGLPTRSLYHYELLIMLCKEMGFHLALEHFWWNPSKLPTPAEWVNIRRIRVKDGVNCVWWLSLSPWPKASNRRVLSPYSESMQDLLKNGYTAKLRPSGHNISTKFSNDNGGSIPPNLLAIANTESNGQYQSYCRENGLAVHPARFPSLLPEYFIKMCTDKNDVVVDPFGGSCVTGEVCERLGRQWNCCELDETYLKGARGRFIGPVKEVTPATTYTIFSPCALEVDDTIPLPEDGGIKRKKKPDAADITDNTNADPPLTEQSVTAEPILQS